MLAARIFSISNAASADGADFGGFQAYALYFANTVLNARLPQTFPRAEDNANVYQ